MSFRIPFPLQHDPPEAPAPVGVVWHSELQTAVVTFDKPLQAALLEAANWTVYTMLSPVTANSASSNGNEVTLHFTGVSGPVSVQYSPPPFDVMGVNGVAVEAFSLPM